MTFNDVTHKMRANNQAGEISLEVPDDHLEFFG